MALVQALVRTDSVAVPPHGHETAAQRVLAAWLRRQKITAEVGARLRVYFQFLPHEDVTAVQDEIEASLHDFAAADPFFARYPLRCERVLDPPLLGHEVATDHPWTRCLHGAAQG